MKHKILSIIGWAGLLILFGIVGGMDTGRITVVAGLIGSAVTLTVSAWSLYKAGWLM